MDKLKEVFGLNEGVFYKASPKREGPNLYLTFVYGSNNPLERNTLVWYHKLDAFFLNTTKGLKEKFGGNNKGG